MPTQQRFALIDALNAEWAQLCAAPAAAQSLARWQHADPVFTAAADVSGVMAAIHCRESNEATLAGLLRQATCGDDFAARAVLQAMLGSMVRLAYRTVHLAGGDHSESISRAVAALWATIASYPVDRRSGHASNLSLEVLYVLTRRQEPAGMQTRSLDEIGDLDLADDLIELAVSHGHIADEARAQPPLLDAPFSARADEQRAGFWLVAGIDGFRRAGDEQLLLLLEWATRTGVVSLPDAQLLLELHSPAGTASAPTASEVARRAGVSAGSVRQRACRAVRHLRAAVQEYASSPVRPIPSALPRPRPPMPAGSARVKHPGQQLQSPAAVVPDARPLSARAA